uniref:Uncharacterized protein n=1 Tax=Nelumbo nucifera TaxID=4432 RepID=A0A822YAC8_NELNU|nr:TPA_asm: hypothetical protein HUJ06_030521 [Nelumbo nucifera]
MIHAANTKVTHHRSANVMDGSLTPPPQSFIEISLFGCWLTLNPSPVL